MGFRTIQENEQVLIFNRQGSARQVSGPRRVSSDTIMKWCRMIGLNKYCGDNFSSLGAWVGGKGLKTLQPGQMFQ